MTKGRLVLVGFGVAALVMIALPVATVWTMTRPGAPEAGLGGDVSKAFLAAEASRASGAAPEPVAEVARLLPKGMAEDNVFKTLAASDFTCATDANAATCFRSHVSMGCTHDWTVRLIFSDDGTVWSTTAKRQATCL